MKEIITNATGKRDTIWLSGFRWGLKKMVCLPQLCLGR